MRVNDLKPAVLSQPHALNLPLSTTFRGRQESGEMGNFQERLFIRSSYAGYSICVDLTSGVTYGAATIVVLELLPDALIYARGVNKA